MRQGVDMEFLWILKKIVSRLFFPLPVVMALLLLGVFWKKKGRHVVLAAAVLLCLFSFAPFSQLLLRPLERPHAPVTAAGLNREVAWVVVLGGGARDEAWLTPEDRLGNEALKRLIEGVRLCRLLPEAHLVLSGGSFRDRTPEAVLMGDIALGQGISPERIILEADSLDTADQARYLNARIGERPFYLVTSASHMTRALGMFKRLGTNPIAAPTDFRALPGPFQVWDLFLQAGALANTERAFYEYLGLAWSRLRGQI